MKVNFLFVALFFTASLDTTALLLNLTPRSRGLELQRLGPIEQDNVCGVATRAPTIHTRQEKWWRCRKVSARQHALSRAAGDVRARVSMLIEACFSFPFFFSSSFFFDALLLERDHYLRG